MRSGIPLTLALSVVGCNDSIDALYAAGKDVPPYVEATTGTSGDESSGGVPTTTSITGDGPDLTSSDLTSSGSTSGDDIGTDTTGSAPLPPPSIVTMDLPLKVSVAGPMQVYVYAENAATAELTLDDAHTFPLTNEGDIDGDGVDLFSGVVPIYGPPDNGPHTLTATARRDGLEDSLSRPFEVGTPPAGALGWEKYGGAASKTTRLATTPDGYVYEGGSFEINGLARPAIRFRDPVTGVNVWKEGARVLDAREGSIADVAVAPDGRVWVAMNVREGNTWIARIAAFTADMEPTEAELEKPGATVTAIDSDSAGGCLAVGFMVTPFGDADVLVWRMTAEGMPILSGYPWDNVPDGQLAHSFTDLAYDVVVDRLTDEAWIVGGSQGDHDINEPGLEFRGIALHVDIDTFDILSPVIVAPPVGNIKHSLFYGAWIEPESLLVTGYQCDMLCAQQSILATRYSFAGVPTWGYSSNPPAQAIGQSIASNTHGIILIAATIKDGMTWRGYLLGRTNVTEAFVPVAFPGKDPSNATSVVVGPYDWPFVAGNATFNGALQGYVMHTH